VQEEETALGVLPVLPWAGASLLLVLLVALNVPAPSGRPPLARVPGSPLADPRVAVLALAAVAGLVLGARLGPASVLTNPVPALVVGLGWPLLFVVPAAVGLVRRRGARPDDAPGAPRDVRPAVAGAALVVGYLALARSPTAPRTLAYALAGYALAALALGIALGPAAVARSEPLGLLGRWAALGPRLVRWHPPRGAAAVLVVVLGGTWAERAQRTSAWFELSPGRLEQVALLLGAVTVAGLAAVALTRWSDGRAAPVLLPATAAAVVASVLRRTMISGQLLWDTAGPGSSGFVPDPLGVAGGQAAALALVTLGGALAAAVLARRVDGGSARLPGTGVVLALTGITAVTVLLP
jgi:hypothetical protein